MDGIITGVLDVMYAVQLMEETAIAAPTYGAPKMLGKSIEVKIKPIYKEGNLDASNAKLRKKKTVNGYDVSLNTANIPPAVTNELMNRVKDANGVQRVNGSNDPIKVAIGFVFTYDDGTREYWWMYKGSFAEAEKNVKTEGDNWEYQTPTIEGSFVRRMDNNDLATVADTNDDSIPASVFTNWFTYVYEPDGDAVPDVDSLPIGSVLTVVELPEAGIVPTAVYVLTADDGLYLAGTMWRYISDAWEEYGAA